MAVLSWRAIPLVLAALCGPAAADTVFAARTLRPDTVITAEDIAVQATHRPGAFSRAQDVLGMEARVVLYAGRPILRGDVVPPALVRRNALVVLVYVRGGLEILAEGRALDRGAEGDRIAVLNAGSRSRVVGVVLADGRIRVE